MEFEKIAHDITLIALAEHLRKHYESVDGEIGERAASDYIAIYGEVVDSLKRNGLSDESE